MSQHTLPGLRQSSTEAGPATASTHDLAPCTAQPKPPSWGSLEKQLAPTWWATQLPEGTWGGPASLQGSLCPRQRNISFPLAPHCPMELRHTPIPPITAFSGTWEQSFGRKLGPMGLAAT